MALPDKPPLDPAPPSVTPHVSLFALFRTFFWVGLFSFGGGMSSWLHREIVHLRGWLTDDQFFSGYNAQFGGDSSGLQGPLAEKGKAFIEKEFPKLDKILRASIVPATPAPGATKSTPAATKAPATKAPATTKAPAATKTTKQ